VGRTLPIWNTFGRVKPFTPEEPWLLHYFDQVAPELPPPRPAPPCRRLMLPRLKRSSCRPAAVSDAAVRSACGTSVSRNKSECVFGGTRQQRQAHWNAEQGLWTRTCMSRAHDTGTQHIGTCALYGRQSSTVTVTLTCKVAGPGALLRGQRGGATDAARAVPHRAAADQDRGH